MTGQRDSVAAADNRTNNARQKMMTDSVTRCASKKLPNFSNSCPKVNHSRFYSEKFCDSKEPKNS